MNMVRILVGILAVLVISGCQAAKETPSPMPPMLPEPAAMTPEERAANPGSLFDDAEADFLFSDNRARRLGDIVLVKIVETTTAKNKAETSTEKESSIELGVENFFGHNRVGLGPMAVAGSLGTTPLLKAGSTSSFDGKGETKRENTLTATIACRVIKVLPGGLLQVEGARETRVNDETQYMVISGLVRTSDVGADNSVKSTQLANSRIAYYGEGVIGDKQKPGWFVRLMDNIWPF
ncbi:flagellar L-ring protein [Desulfovibrio psychrotolerans]|uniref:Flagellar L-ring protein n=2 Tax=Desulfovibrio psychrotolerans TaxID=415242 RepID=A0A7J0BVU4_9BACT|nr:flagellar L-ring protein [Desulfovibrio psychrotolerans]